MRSLVLGFKADDVVGKLGPRACWTNLRVYVRVEDVRDAISKCLLWS